MQCEVIESQLDEIADSPESISPLVEHHLRVCLHCQADAAKYRKLRRLSLSLKNHVLAPDDDLLGDILQAVKPPATVHRIHRKRSRKVAYVGGIAVSAAAGAFVVASRLANRDRAAS